VGNVDNLRRSAGRNPALITFIERFSLLCVCEETGETIDSSNVVQELKNQNMQNQVKRGGAQKPTLSEIKAAAEMYSNAKLPNEPTPPPGFSADIPQGEEWTRFDLEIKKEFHGTFEGFTPEITFADGTKAQYPLFRAGGVLYSLPKWVALTNRLRNVAEGAECWVHYVGEVAAKTGRMKDVRVFVKENPITDLPF
jgi:hypothetical protein